MVSRTDGEKVLRSDRVLLSLAVACALFIGGLVYVLKNGTMWTPVNDSTYVALRNAYRVVDFLHLRSVSSVQTNVLRRQPPSGMERLGIEIFILVTVLGITAAVSLLFSLLSYMRGSHVVVKRLTLAFLLFAAPASYLTVSWLTGSWAQREPWNPPRGSFIRENLPFMAFIGEIACLCVILLRFYFRRKALPKWAVTLLISVHFAFWIFVFWRETLWLFPIYSRDLVLLLVPALPFVYMLQDRDRLERARGRLKTRWALGIAMVALISFAAVWVPTKTVSLSNPEDLAAVKIELARGPCFGSCSQYTITVQGDGRVEYSGRQRYSRFDSRKVGKIEREKITQILQTLDQVRFMTLDDRAFSWGFDTPSVGVRIWEDGKTKQVVSDAGFVGSKNGRQSRLVDATQEIDSILKSTKWDSCEGEECVSPPSTEPTPANRVIGEVQLGRGPYRLPDLPELFKLSRQIVTVELISQKIFAGSRTAR